MGLSLAQRSPTDCGASFCVIYKPRESGGHGSMGVVKQRQNKQNISSITKQTKVNKYQ